MEITTETVVICRYCLQRMQVANTIWNDRHDRVIAQRYVCGCQTPPFQHNIQSGDTTKDKP